MCAQLSGLCGIQPVNWNAVPPVAERYAFPIESLKTSASASSGGSYSESVCPGRGYARCTPSTFCHAIGTTSSVLTARYDVGNTESYSVANCWLPVVGAA